MTKEEVLKEFDKGYDCGQVVLGHWAEELGLDVATAYKIASGFGAGMYQGETCGAIIGAYMVLGLKYGHCKPGEAGERQRVESIIKNVQFRQNFLDKYKATMCRELLEADMSTEEGAKHIREKQLMNTFCPQLVADVIEILDEIM